MVGGIVANECPKFNAIIFGKNGEFRATRQGNKVFIENKDGLLRTTDVETFMKVLVKSLPKMKSQLTEDTFSREDIAAKNSGFSIGKFYKNLTELQTINPDDDILTRLSKTLHNAGAIHYNPLKIQDYFTGKYSA